MDRKTYQKKYLKDHKEQHAESQKKWHDKNKKHLRLYYQEKNKKRIETRNQLIKERGGKCQICGGAFNYACYDFHHIEKKEKSLAKLADLMITNNKEKIQKEIDKCILVCSNCHRIIHFNKDQN